MKSPQGFPTYRIAIAVALSILAHSLMLWQLPKIEWPATKEELPRLQAKLELVPKLAKKNVARKPKDKILAPPNPIPETLVAPVITDKTTAVAAEPKIICDLCSSKIIIVSAVSVATELAATSAVEAAETMAVTPPAKQSVSPPPLPKHAQLRFAVQFGGGSFKVGEVLHELENIDGHYMLRSAIQTTGLVGLFKNYYLSQTSMGTVSKQGLRPDSFEELKKDSSGTQTTTASFDWRAHKIHFSNGTEQPLIEQAQDVLSLPYQLSQLPLSADGIQVALSNGRNINQYYIAVGDEGIITTAMGDLRTIALSKVHGANEEGLIIWLALEYRLLPVKILYLNKSGEVSANMVITDIRVSDE